MKKCENCHGICVFIFVSIVYRSVLKVKLEECITGSVGEDQTGLATEKSCMDLMYLIYTLQKFTEKLMAINRVEEDIN